MRVISGKYKGRKIQPPINDNIRPTSDKVKEALFAVLQNDVNKAVVIDLFAGTGGLGIEALSRGAEKVYFCDGGAEAIELIKKNAAFLEKESYEILRGAYEDCLRRLATRGVKADIVLCDPPYGKGIPEAALKEIDGLGIVKDGGIVAVERKTTDKAQREHFAYVSEKIFGETSLDFYRNITKCAVTGTFDPFTLGHKFVVEKALEKYGFCYVAMLVNENKKARYSVGTRIRMAELSLTEYRRRIRIDYYEGMATDYCRENGIKVIYRGYRNDADKKYEDEMAGYNYAHGKVETVIVKAENEISSSRVKEAYDKGESVAEYVSADVTGLMRRR